MTETERAQTERIRDRTTEGLPGTDTKRGSANFRPTTGANMAEPERAQRERRRDRRTARHSCKEEV